MIGDEGDAPPPPDPEVVLDPVVGGIRQLDRLGPKREGDLGAMHLEVAALMGIGRVHGGAHGQLHPELDGNLRGLLLEVAETPFFLVQLLAVDVIADPGFEIRGDLGAAVPDLSLRALGQVGPLDAQGR
jgi:hypothetical protein